MVPGMLALLGVLAPAAASGSSSGEITRGEVNPAWTSVSFAGAAIRSNGCPPVPPKPPPEPLPPVGEEVLFSEEGPKTTPPPPIQPKSEPWQCGWIAYATLGPGQSQSDCSLSSRRFGSLGGEVQLVWTSTELKGVGAAAFDLGEVALEHGLAAPLLCLAAVEAVPEGIVCGADRVCLPYGIVHAYYQLDSAVLKLTPPPETPSRPCPARWIGRKSAKKKVGSIGIGNRIAVSRKAKHVRRCKTG